MKFRRTVIAAVLLLGIFGFAYSQTQVPHTFQSGDPARAVEVNENFSALAADINAVAGIAVPTTFGFVGFSSGVITPDQGVFAMGDLCRADYGPDARMATTQEIFQSTRTPLGTSSDGGSWAQPITRSYDVVYQNMSCFGWGADFQNATSEAIIVDQQGRFRRTRCVGSRTVACSAKQ